MYDKRDGFGFDIFNLPFHDGYFPRCPSYGVYMTQFVRIARASLHVSGFNSRNTFLNAKLPSSIGIINPAKYFPDFTVDTMN